MSNDKELPGSARDTGDELEPVPANPEAVVDSSGVSVGTPLAAASSSSEAISSPQATPGPEDEGLEMRNEQVRRQMRRRTRRGFLGLAAGAVLGFGGWEWLISRREIDGVPWPFRHALEINEQLARDYFRPRRLSPSFPPGRAGVARLNGDEGMDDSFDPSQWKLQVQGLASQNESLELALEDLKKLPRVEMTTELKCIEGWSAVVTWAGARFTDFMRAYSPETTSGDPFSLDRAEDLPPYVTMATPGNGYYVGLDMESMLHPQTLLCYEMNGAPLTDEHGAPLRLVIPVKYGIKNIKRIGTIRFSTLRPADYWAEQGYDWYAGL